MNLWKETIETLEKWGYKWDDVKSVFGYKFQITKENFERVAKETDYDEGYGAAKVAEDLMILLNDGAWMSREEYDGSEWWSVHKTPTPPAEVKEVKWLTTREVGWDSLEECQKETNLEWL